MKALINRMGQAATNGVAELGYVFMLLLESFRWLLFGTFRKQPVHTYIIAREVVWIGVQAIPIVVLLSFAVGAMLSIQTIHSLSFVGAELRVADVIGLAMTREFAPLIIGILVAGRSGSAITARIGTMHESQEIDALRVMGIDPVRYLAAPVLLAMMIAVPCLALIGDFAGILGSAVYTKLELGMSLDAYYERCFVYVGWEDIRQGIIKSVVFGMIITAISVSNGFQVGSGSEGVGLSTTRSVVLSISFIVLADLVFSFVLTH